MNRLLTGLLLAGFSLPGIASAGPVTVTITRVQCVADCDEAGLEALFESKPDFYAKVFINGVEQRTPRADDDQDDISPYWTVTVDIPGNFPGFVPVRIELWDHDSTSGDDRADASPIPGDDSFDIEVGSDGRWKGDSAWPFCTRGDDNSGTAVRVCIDISVWSASGDGDGDGLLDGWERNGYNDNGDGSIDVNLPAMGARFDHKDLFLELDYMPGNTPTRAGIQAMRAAFAAAPANAGGIPNPDGQPGITLHLDTGNLTDPTAPEGGGTCGDGIDNEPDGLADANDPDCLVGDNLGGGNMLPLTPNCELDGIYFNLKQNPVNFNPSRRPIFRYAISGTSNCTLPNGNPRPTGGQGELGGNDFIDYNHDGGTIMHELGHNLTLRHGGNVNANCSVNYVSVMNYDHQFGINVLGGGRIFDYSPPRFGAGGRGVAPLPGVNEGSLNDSQVLDATDTANRFIFVSPAGQKLQRQLNQAANWNNDTDPPVEATLPAINVNTSGVNGAPAACTNGATNDAMNGFHDWNAISLPFRQFGDSASAAINPETQQEPTLQDLLRLREELNTTDVALTKTDSPDPVAAGTNLTYTLLATNNGPNPSSNTQVVDTLPSGVSFVSGPCTQTPIGTLTCSVGELADKQQFSVGVTVKVDADLVYNAGAPTNITNFARGVNLAGPDPLGDNNTMSVSTRVIAVADLSIIDFTPMSPPKEAIVGQPVQVTLRKTITNSGPSAPMDVKLTKTATPPAGAVVSPTNSSATEVAVALNEIRNVDETFTVTCQEASHHLFTFDNDIQPARPDDTDPTQTNNKKQIKLDVECVVPVRINVKPGSLPNSYNLNGAIPIAVLSTSVGQYGLPLAFDASRIDPLSVRFGPREAVLAETGGAFETHKRGHLEDSVEMDEKTRDRDIDMVLHFDAGMTGLNSSHTEACIKGQWLDSANNRHRFFGCDSIRLVPK